MLVETIPNRATIERAVERVRRAAKGLSVRGDRAQRRKLLASLPHNKKLDGVVDEARGHAKLPAGLIERVEPAVEIAQQILAERRNGDWQTEKRHRPVLLSPKRYEEAPAFFDLALSDDILQIAGEYLGEVPVLLNIKLWWSPVNQTLKGSQLFHRDGMNWFQRRAKFLFNMIDVDENCGPFTFLPADVSWRVANALGSLHIQERVADEEIYRHAKPADAISVVGPAGAGAMVDSSRCFHFGGRARGGERLILMFHFLDSIDVSSEGSGVHRSPGFAARFGSDPVRGLVIANRTEAETVIDDSM